MVAEHSVSSDGAMSSTESLRAPRPLILRMTKTGCVWHLPSLQQAQVTNLSDLRRAFQDEIGDVFRQKRSRDVCRYVVDELRGHVNDEVVRVALEAVFVCDAVLHGQARRE